MRILSKLILASFALSLPLTMVACSDDDADDGNNGGAGNTGGTGGDSDGSGGKGTGGNAPVAECEADAPNTFTLDDCQDDAGPTAAVLCSDIGAFKGDSSWMDGWTNWSLNSSGVGDAEPDVVVEADITTDTTWTADKVWGLKGTVHVTNGATLTIEPGTIIKGQPAPTPGTLVVSRDGKISAVGTKDKPIVFTSTQKDGSKTAGGWGGLVLLGRANNFEGDNVDIEGLASEALNQHGPGDGVADDKHNCGELKYVRLEFGGIELQPDNEINGLTFGSCGSDTKVSYVQVNTTLDDGFEWFGGANSADHLVVNNAGDDSFDIDTGWRGTMDTIFARQIEISSSNPNGFEWDSSNAGATPVTKGIAKNATLCGSGVAASSVRYGAVLREGITGEIDNLAVLGFDVGFDTRDNFGTQSNPNIKITNSTSWEQADGVAYDETLTKDEATAAGTPWLTDNDNGFDEAKWFRDGAGNVDGDAE